MVEQQKQNKLFFYVFFLDSGCINIKKKKEYTQEHKMFKHILKNWFLDFCAIFISYVFSAKQIM